MILRSDRFRGPRMVMLAFFIMNLAVGLTYGAFGALVLPLEAHFGTTRSLISLAMSLVVLNSGLLAPLIGTLIGRFSIRKIMLSGAVLITGVSDARLCPERNPDAVLLCLADWPRHDVAGAAPLLHTRQQLVYARPRHGARHYQHAHPRHAVARGGGCGVARVGSARGNSVACGRLLARGAACSGGCRSA